jgi:hypothetical protein
MSTIKSKQRLFLERVMACFPQTHVLVRCDLSDVGTEWSVYCTGFPKRMTSYHWSGNFKTLHDMEAWFEAAVTPPPPAEPVDTVEVEETTATTTL